jgi:hypothetical protein
LHRAYRYFKEEQSRVDRYLQWDEIRDGLFRVFKEEMMLKHQESLLDRETGIKYLLQNECTEELGLLYTLYQTHPENL